ncbi:ribosomal biogenesis factor [Mastomys coucha]|uniref:ribosomal biogenesis factor n=1 Tax=Mastomys coucha TaxID=35658 RepID=UPI0012627813|nr:ribosomal biogenesis factor [Mastomys coucha]XP_031232222.1 ribosomal biogenesis factor [Mastomys coucha]XP_031232223.1 ribosomal biogenesis factor [Mastomys coucha]XP_031232224.1 ribosomal biogenesis factor [Mastomys coucha]
MAKNKLKGQKSRNVFHIASHKTFKAKNKAKPVTTNLKKGCLCSLKDLNEDEELILQSWEILGAATSTKNITMNIQEGYWSIHLEKVIQERAQEFTT